MSQRLFFALLSQGFATFLLAAPALAQCSALVSGPVNPGDVIALPSKHAGQQTLSESQPLTKRRRLRLAVVLAPSPFETGALIVKSQHRDDAGVLVGSPDWVDLKRDRHLAACTNRDRAAFSRPVPMSKYMDYHFYYADDFSPQDQNLDTFHTEVGLRPYDGWLWRTSTCRWTYDGSIRFQFVFDENRRVSSLLERAGHVVVKAQNTLKQPPVLQAAEKAGYSAQIVPYRRTPNEPSCVTGSVDVPKSAAITTISVIDADEAAAPGFSDPQRTRTVIWRNR
jgi:hypothetical protein